MLSGYLIIYIAWNAVVKVVQLFTINNGCLYFGHKKKNGILLLSPSIN